MARRPPVDDLLEEPEAPSRADEFVKFAGAVMLAVFIGLALLHWPLWLMIPAVPGAVWLAAKRDRRRR